MSYNEERPRSLAEGENNQFHNANRPHQPYEMFHSSSHLPWSNPENSSNPWAPQLHNNPQNIQLLRTQTRNSLNFSLPPSSNFQNVLPPNPYPPVHSIAPNYSSYFPPPPPQQNLPFYGDIQAHSGAPQQTSNANAPRLPFPPNINFNRPPPPVASTFMQPPPPINAPFNAHFPPLGSIVSAGSVPENCGSKSQKPMRDKDIGYKKLENWLQLKKKHLKPEHKGNQAKGKFSVKVWDFVNKLQEMQELINSLSNQVAGLASAALQTDELAWGTSKDACDSIKEKLSTEYGWLLDEHCIQDFGSKLKQIHGKRARLKRARKIKFDESQLLHQQWNEKSKNIDRWQERLRFKIQEENKERKQKAAADRTLSKVTREIQDATRLIDTMLGLEKLRLIRRDAAQKRGDSDVGESRQSFEDKIGDMTRLVKAQLECYKEEETKLKFILKSEEEEKTKQECKSREEKARREQEEEDSKLRLILFGPNDAQSMASPLYPFSQYYNQARHSLAAFLQIRHEWDAYLVSKGTPASSCIPGTWVTPDPPNSSSWSAALQ